MFEPRVALASLSGESDAAWARAGAAYAGAAFLGGLAIDDPTQAAAADLVARGRSEFTPADPVAFVDAQFDALGDAPVRPAINVRAASPESVRAVARECARHDAILEVNAHCRQAEMCAVGCGERLLKNTTRLCEHVAAAAASGASVSVKVRAEVEGVDLRETARAVVDAGADALHVDAMDTEGAVAVVANAAPTAFVIANNGVRDRATVREYLAYGADAVSVGRPSDDPAVLCRVREAVAEWRGRPLDTGDRRPVGVSR